MIVAIIRWSIFNRGLVVLGALLVAVLGLVTLKICRLMPSRICLMYK